MTGGFDPIDQKIFGDFVADTRSPEHDFQSGPSRPIPPKMEIGYLETRIMKEWLIGHRKFPVSFSQPNCESVDNRDLHTD